MPEFGSRLRELRRAAGLTMEQLAEASGVSARAISDMERGHSRAPQARTLAALATGLGLDPGQLGDLEDVARRRRAHSAGRPRLCEPPRAISDFVGRADELDRMRRHALAGLGPAPVAVVHGQPGLGKTALAVRLADQLRDRYPDGRFYLDLRGTDAEPMSAGDALVRLLRALEVGPRRIAETDDERSSQLRAVLRERRCLLVLDNAGSEAQVRPLLPSEGESLAVVTSRRVLGGLAGVERIALAPLAPHESAALLRAIAVQAADPRAAAGVEAVARLCGHLPLALRIAGTRLATRPAWTVEHLVARLADADRRLATLTTGDIGVATAFALSHAQLSKPARELFRRLAHVPGVDFAATLAAVLTGGHPDDTADGLDELVDLGLLQQSGPDRYRFHDLIRLFAEERLRIEEPAGTRAATAKKMSDWLLETAIVAGRWFEPGYGRLPDGWGGPVALGTAEEADTWLQAERANWLGAMRSAARGGQYQLVVDVAEAMHWYSDKYVRADYWYEVYGMSRAAAARLPDRRQEATHLNYFSWAATHCARRPGEGAEIAMDAYRIAAGLGDLKEQSWALRYAGDAWRHGGMPERALDAYRRATELADRAGDHDGYIQLRPGIARALIALGRHEEAIEECAATLRDIETRPVAARPELSARVSAHGIAAESLAESGRWAEALREAERAMPYAVEFGYPGYLGELHLTIGRARMALGLRDAARPALRKAVELLDDLPHQRWRQLARQGLAALGETA
ncbi:ATP-binding protein [Actinoplanes teichomyceticus]|uniref:ATP-binding protein n=1 Tax=Actinoplanes teichomyceticus TaxID=1867 RepID=UPI000F09BCE7|nr:helix-turn-helix domain-containing protein [Actinoplanes teichomyceticus]